MAYFLTTKGVSYHIDEIIKNASETLVIISPYLKIDKHTKELLERKEIGIYVLYRELDPKEKKWLDSMKHIQTRVRKNLHAKCYLNEDYALLTSMNLYEYSQVNNDEMGIFVSFEDDEDLYVDIWNESIQLLEWSEEEKAIAKRARRVPRQATAKPAGGFCIRCKTDLPSNPKQPYCSRCFASWRGYSNAEYEEKHCHTCGKEHGTSMEKPVCIACFRKYKDVLEFAAG